MRIPRSVIVMSVVTAVPFGLGIRDMFKHGTRIPHEDAAESARQRALDDYEAEARREASEREAKNDERKARLAVLYGPKVAQMGSLFDGIELGSAPETYVRGRIDNATRDGFFRVMFNSDSDTLNYVHVAIGSDAERDEVCSALVAKLTTVWGAGRNGSWVDPVTKQRATIDEDRCELSFSSYLPTAEWVAALPFDVIGKSWKAVEAGSKPECEDDRAYWMIPGLRDGKLGASHLEALLAGGRVAGVKVTAEGEFDTVLEVRDAISARLKTQPKKDQDSGVWNWKGKVVLDPSQAPGTGRFSVMIGKMPWD